MVGVLIGWQATDRCWVYSARSNSNFNHVIDRCRFHNSEHGGESMSAQRTTFFNCPDSTSCYKESDVVPNSGWVRYNFVSCCSISRSPST
jgi:hypothetical protein